jgi:hypothetical protein
MEPPKKDLYLDPSFQAAAASRSLLVFGSYAASL